MKKTISTILAILVIFSFSAIAIASNSSDAETSSVEKSGETQAEVKQEAKAYKLGETVNIKTDSGDYNLTFTKIEESSDRNEFADKQPQKIILIHYDIENITCDDDLYVSDMNMKLYDKQNNALDTYPSTQASTAQSIGQGRKSSGIVAFGLDSDDNYIELEYYDNMFNSKSDCKFVLEW